MKKCYFLLLLFWGMAGSLAGQVPAHFMLGARELAGIHVYGLVQSAEGRYWITTNDGLYSYDGYAFQKYTHPDLLNNSLFHPVLDQEDNFYCYNLNGQIFRVREGKMELFHTVPDSLMFPYLSFGFLPNQEMLINSKNIYRVREGKIHSQISENDYKYAFGFFTAHPDGDLTLPIRHDSLLHFSETEVSGEKVIFPGDGMDSTNILTRSIFHPKGRFFINSSKQLWGATANTEAGIQVQKHLEPPSSTSQIFLTSERILIADARAGLRIASFADILAENPVLPPLIFRQHFISAVYEDRAGNILLGTFGDGIIVIPKTGALNFDLLPRQQVSQICPNGKGGLFVGGFNGNLYEYQDGEVRPHFLQGKKFIELLAYFPEDSLLFLDKGPVFHFGDPVQVEFEQNVLSVKDIVRIGPDRYVLSSNVGLFTISRETFQDAYPFIRLGPNRTRRAYAIACHRPDSAYLASTAKGLLYLNAAGEESLLDFRGTALHVQDLSHENGITYVGTQNHGLLTWDGQALQLLVDTTRQLLSNQIEQLQIHQDQIYIASAGGFQIFDLTGNLIKTLSATDGLQSVKIKDFAVDEDYIWLLHQYGLQRLPRAQTVDPSYQSRLQTVQMFQNNQLVPQAGALRFSHDQNRIKFKVLAPSLERQKDLTYAYRLQGLEQDWNEKPYLQNEIEYKSLPPGDFRFEVALKYKGMTQDRYSVAFRIRPAFWQTWWFALLLVLLIVGLSYLFYRRRLHLQQLRSDRINELNASRLTAIQSQMNPHFIFNALNSIQNLVLKGDIDNSYTYITKFANLLRRTLNYSDKDLIEFEQEVKLIELYLTLERLRFQKNFEFEIDTGDIQDILVPPLLIQPFIENALLHGLLHKEGPKRISIRFELQAQLLCTITDNGVGRARAAEIKARKRGQHESFSQKAIKRRFEILESHFGGELGFEFIDLKEGEVATGSQVILRIPVKRRF